MDNFTSEPEPTVRFQGGVSKAPEAGEAGRALPVIEGYEILRQLGRGGMGVVYEARQLKLNRIVALKMVLAGEYAGERVMARFLAEAEIAAGLQHSNITQIYELGEAMGLPYIAMEFVGGCSMADRVKTFGNDFRAIAGFFEKLARATHWAHQHSVIHRDLKPGNVLIGLDGEPKIADFGLAKRLDEDPDRPVLTKSGEQMGTPAYMAPEQAFPEMGGIGPATDVYSLGVMLYEVLAGKVPFSGASPMEILAKLHSEDPSSPAWLRTGLPRDLETICLKCLRKKPKDRYASAGELADDLRRYINDESILAKPPSSLTKTFRWVRRHRVSVSVAVTVLVAAGVAAGFWSRQQYLSEKNQAERRAVQEKYDELYVREFASTFANFTKKNGQYVGVGPLTAEDRARRCVSYEIVRAGREGNCVRLTIVDAAGRPGWYWTAADMLVPGIFDEVPRHRRPCIFELRYNPDGHVSEERLFDAAGQFVARLRYSYPDGYDPGNPQTGYIQADFLDESSRPIESDTTPSSVQIQRDRDGYEHRLLYADTRGNPRKDKDAAGGLLVMHNPAGLVEVLTVLDENGKPAANAKGKAVLKFTWNQQGLPVSMAFFDLNNKPVSVEGYHLVCNEYDPAGNVIAIRCFGADGTTPAPNYSSGGAGATEIRWTMDGRGFPLTLTSSGFDTGKTRFASLVTQYEWKPDGAVTTLLESLDSGGNRVRSPAGFSALREEFDARGRELRSTSENYNPEKTGYFRQIETTEWSPQGDKLRSTITYQDEKGGTAHERISGAGHRVKEYGSGGRLVRETMSEFEMAPYDHTVVENEWEQPETAAVGRFPGLIDSAGITAADDAPQAGPVEAPRGTSAVILPSRSSIRAAIDSGSAKLVRKTGHYLDKEGKPVPCSNGNSMWVREYYPDGRARLETHSGFQSDYPYVRIAITTTYKEKEKSEAKIVLWEYFDGAGQPVRNKEHYLTYREEFDGEGRVASATKSGYDKERAGYVTEVSEFSNWKGSIYQRRHWSYRDAAGKPARYPDGYTDYTEEYDESGVQSRIVATGYDPAIAPSYTQIAIRKPGTTPHTYVLLGHWEDENGNRAHGRRGEMESFEEYSEEDGRLVAVTATGFDEAQHGFVKVTVRFENGMTKDLAYTDGSGGDVTRVRPYVSGVNPGGPADMLGIRRGDVILKYNGKEIANSFEFIARPKPEGGTLELLRGGKPLTITNVPQGKLGIYVGDTARQK